MINNMNTFDTLYNDFTTNVLPKLAEWIEITKDYAFDLFERYITYLIIVDVLWLIFTTLITFVIIFSWYKFYKTKKPDLYDSMIMLLLMLLFLTFPVVWIFECWTNLIKDLTIPEIRIYEEFNSYNN